MQFNARVRAVSPSRPEGDEEVYSYHQMCAWLVELLWQGRMDKSYRLIIRAASEQEVQFTVHNTHYEITFGEHETWNVYILDLFMSWVLLHKDTSTPEVYAFFRERFASQG